MHFGLAGPTRRTVFATLFSFEFIPCLSYCLEQSAMSGWILRSKSLVFIFTTILKFKSVKIFNSVLPKLSQSPQKIPLRRFTSFVKEATIQFIVVYVTAELPSLS